MKMVPLFPPNKFWAHYAVVGVFLFLVVVVFSHPTAEAWRQIAMAFVAAAFTSYALVFINRIVGYDEPPIPEVPHGVDLNDFRARVWPWLFSLGTTPQVTTMYDVGGFQTVFHVDWPAMNRLGESVRRMSRAPGGEVLVMGVSIEFEGMLKADPRGRVRLVLCVAAKSVEDFLEALAREVQSEADDTVLAPDGE